MITEVIEYLGEQAKLNGISEWYQDLMPSTETNNICAIRLLNGASENNLCATEMYATQLIQILYRGTTDKKASLDIAESVQKALNNTNNVSYLTSEVIHIQAAPPVFAFQDEKNYINYSITLDVIYK